MESELKEAILIGRWITHTFNPAVKTWPFSFHGNWSFFRTNSKKPWTIPKSTAQKTNLVLLQRNPRKLMCSQDINSKFKVKNNQYLESQENEKEKRTLLKLHNWKCKNGLEKNLVYQK